MDQFHLAIIYGWLFLITLFMVGPKVSDWIDRHKRLAIPLTIIWVIVSLMAVGVVCGGFPPNEKEGDTSIDNADAMIVNGVVDRNCEKVVGGFDILRKSGDSNEEETFGLVLSLIMGVGLVGIDEARDFIDSCLEGG